MKLWNGFIATVVTLILPLFAFTQGKKAVQVKQADALYTEPSKTSANILQGNVILEHDRTLMYCDSALLFQKSNSFQAFTNVKIKQGDSLIIRGERLDYNGNTKKAVIIGRVSVNTKEMTLATDTLHYNMETHEATYFTGGKITGKENGTTLTSRIGRFDTKRKVFYFKKKVKLINPDYTIDSDTLVYNANTEISTFHGPTKIKSKNDRIYCENGWYNTVNKNASFWKKCVIYSDGQEMRGDSLFYNEKKGIGQAFGHVIIIDTANHLVVYGNYASHDRNTDSSIVTGNAQMIQKDKKDTLCLKGDQLIVLTNKADKKKIIKSFGRTRIFNSDMQAVCDSLIYIEKDSLMTLRGNPVIWSDSSQITGEIMKLNIYKGKIEKLEIDGNALISSRSKPGYYNQIKGNIIIGHFQKNEIKKVFVFEQGQTIYFMENNKKPIVDVNISTCTNIVITLKENKIKRIKFLDSPSSTMKSIASSGQDELLLPGFSWQEKTRPKRNEFRK